MTPLPADRTVAARRRARLFVEEQDQPRSRRATDVITLVAAALGLALLSLIAVPQAGFERAFITFVRHIPSGFDGFWQLLIDLVTVLAVALVIAAVVRRRWAALRDVVLAVLVAIAVAATVDRAVHGSWESAWASFRGVEPTSWFPPLRLTISAAIVVAASPHVIQPVRRVGRWFVGLAAVATVLLGLATPIAATASLLAAAIGAAAVHLGFGSSVGRPSLDEVEAALASLGTRVRSIGAAQRQRSGLFLVDAVDEHGDPLVVKVHGRDASDTQLLATAWRTAWYREAGAPRSFRRLQQVEHEAFLTLLVGQSRILTDRVVTAGATDGDDALLVLRPAGIPLETAPEQWSEARVDQVWDALGRLHAIGVTHGQVDDQHLVVADDAGGAGAAVGIVGFGGGAVAPTPQQLHTDDAQALVTTALAIGPEPALAAAYRALGPDGLATALPFVQPAALTGHQRALVKPAGLDLDELRARAAELAGMDAPELVRLRRVKASAIIQIALLVVAFFALSSAMAGIDLQHLGQQLNDAKWWFIAVGFVLAQTPRPAQAIATMGASPTPVPLGPLYGLQLASSYLNLAVPSSAGRIAANVRFFQRHGLATGAAFAVGVLDGVADFAIQLALLFSLLLLTPASLDVDLSGAVPGGLTRLVGLIVIIGLVVIAVLFALPRWRRRIFGFVREFSGDAVAAAKGLRSPRRIGMLFGGNLLAAILFAVTLGAFAGAFGYRIGLIELLFINVSVSLLASFLPIPGGIGVVEGGLTLGLVRAGMPEETAFAAVILYRLAVFYLPPIWGFFALHWLERNKHL